MITFPFIAPAFDGMALSAGQLNVYKQALEYLLGEGHAPICLECADEHSHYEGESDAQPVWDGYIYHLLDNLHFTARFRHDYGEPTEKRWHARLQVYDDTKVWKDAWSHEGGNSLNWHNIDVGIALSPAIATMTKGKFYRWRVLTWVSNDGEMHVESQVWTVGELQDALPAVWVAPPIFSGVSAAAQLEALRTDLQNLKALRTAPIVSHTATPTLTLTTDHGWHTLLAGAYRYVPDGLTLGIYYQQGGSNADTNFEYRVLMQTFTGAEQTVVPATLVNCNTDSKRWLEQEVTFSGITEPARRAPCRLLLQIAKGNGSDHQLSVKAGLMARRSSGTPAAGWQTIDPFGHGGTNASPLNMGRFSTDLQMLYDGAEALELYIPACRGQSFLDTKQQTGIHRKRFLIYRHNENKSPRLYWGENLSENANLKVRSDKWNCQDLAQQQLPWGACYYIEDCNVSFESDEVIEDA